MGTRYGTPSFKKGLPFAIETSGSSGSHGLESHGFRRSRSGRISMLEIFFLSAALLYIFLHA